MKETSERQQRDKKKWITIRTEITKRSSTSSIEALNIKTKNTEN